jgi:hypothetical protein
MIIKKKILTYATVALLLMLILFIIDVYKLYKEEKPPIPEITLEGEPIQTVLGSYNYHGTKVKADDPVKMMLDFSGEQVKENQKLVVTFPADKKPKKITISQWNTVPGVEKKSGTGDTFTIPPSFSSQPDQKFYFKIKAEWEKDLSTYYVKLRIQDLPYFHEFFSRDPEKHSVLAIVPRGESEKYDIPEDLKNNLDSFHLSDDIETLKKEYPELQSTPIPYYMVFNTEFMVWSTPDKEELIRWLAELELSPAG